MVESNVGVEVEGTEGKEGVEVSGLGREVCSHGYLQGLLIMKINKLKTYCSCCI